MTAMQAHRAVKPVSPAAGYVGGKRNLAKLLIQRIEAIPHDLYAEPFVGMGGVFLRRKHAPKIEIINDGSVDVINLFRILQRHYEAFMDMLKWQLTSRDHFNRLKDAEPSSLTDLERAARFLYLQRLSFGGKVEGRVFGVDRTSPARFDVLKLAPALAEIHERMSGVVIENLGYAEFIRRYDRPGALFFMDPPYWGSEGYYGPQFARSDFEVLAEQLRSIKGRFLLTINDRPETRAVFAGFEIEAVNVTYTVKREGSLKAGELIISNRPR